MQHSVRSSEVGPLLLLLLAHVYLTTSSNLEKCLCKAVKVTGEMTSASAVATQLLQV
jgi:hypothetical protein